MKPALHWTVFLWISSACSASVPVLDGPQDGGPDAGTVVVDAGRDAGVSVDGGVDRDGAVGVDAPGSSDHYFRAAPATTDFWVAFERCEATAGASTVLSVTMHWFSTCHTPGPISVTVDEPSRTVSVSGTLWEEVGGEAECTSTGSAITRDVVVPPLSPGTWTVNGELMLDVGPVPPPVTCTSPGPLGSACLADCDCMEGACIGMRGDAVCAARCQIPCFTDFDCGVGRTCVADATWGSHCEGRTADSCAGGDCPVGMRCQMGPSFRECEWDTNLRGSTRSPCRTNADCIPSHDCVEAGGERHCEVRCSTETMRCPSAVPHECVPSATATPGQWVCEWLGE